jgi:hypothetical protein
VPPPPPALDPVRPAPVGTTESDVDLLLVGIPVEPSPLLRRNGLDIRSAGPCAAVEATRGKVGMVGKQVRRKDSAGVTGYGAGVRGTRPSGNGKSAQCNAGRASRTDSLTDVLRGQD